GPALSSCRRTTRNACLASRCAPLPPEGKRMSTLSREEIAGRLKQLPSLPGVVSELLSSFGQDDIDVDIIAQQIARDQALAARVLRVANSSFSGLQNRVSTIQEAVTVLGFRAVRSMVVAVGMSGTFRHEQCPEFDARIYLRHG